MPISIIRPLIGFLPQIQHQLKKYPFEQNVFLMLRFRDENRSLSDFVVETLKKAGLRGVRADNPEWNITNNVYNPVAVLYCCKYGIALFDEAEDHQAYNPNVIYELGMMQCLDRECLILKNDSLPAVPFDIIKDLYMPYKGDLAVRANVEKWLTRLGAFAVPSAHPKDPQTGLERAVASAQESEGNTVVASPDSIASTDFTWKVAQQGEKTWKFAWSLKLANQSERDQEVNIQILFLDRNGFALEDRVGRKLLAAGKRTSHTASLTMSRDLGERVHHAMVTISV